MNDFWSETQRVFVGENLTDETAGVETEAMVARAAVVGDALRMFGLVVRGRVESHREGHDAGLRARGDRRD